ncbi:chemotaxis protein CheD [Cesiribacter sp. SM1]|uniref:chemotaxis protein CheD n=1 Tax=Cesiribacter sp. SM1 TaxID=2861196 RepID=UPI001CD2C81D|nr:chemotaxis protein CheD [Cesiribacter sp. SM1]
METTSEKHYLYPAALFVSKKPTLVTTILGTCVAVCLYDPVQQVGGINHYMLSKWDGNGAPSLKYGDYAIQKLLEKMLSSGAEKKHLQAKVFGGLCKRASADVYSIGAKNIKVAETLLAQLQIPVVAKHLGGFSPRKLVFNTQTGTVDMKLLLPDLIAGKKN